MVFSSNGYVVHFPKKVQDPHWEERGAPLDMMHEFGDRRPIVQPPNQKDIYIGEPGWFHEDIYDHFKLNNARPGDGNYNEGFIGGGRIWGDGHLKWYMDPPHNHPDIAEALINAGIPVKNTELDPIKELPPVEPDWEEGWDDLGFHHHGSVEDFEHWWKKKGPSLAKASILAEYAAGEHLDRDEAKRYIDDHESEIKGDPDDFRRRFFRKFDALTRS